MGFGTQGHGVKDSGMQASGLEGLVFNSGMQACGFEGLVFGRPFQGILLPDPFAGCLG